MRGEGEGREGGRSEVSIQYFIFSSRARRAEETDVREWECGVGMRGDSQMDPIAVIEMSPTSQMFPTRTLTLHAKNSWTTVATMPTIAGSSHDASWAGQQSRKSLSQPEHGEQYLLRTLQAHIVRPRSQSSICL